jgi:hypothetical protein
VGQSWQNEPISLSTSPVNCQQVARFAANTDCFGVPNLKPGEDCLNEVQFLSRGVGLFHSKAIVSGREIKVYQSRPDNSVMDGTEYVIFDRFEIH